MGWHRNADEIERIIEKSRENDYHVDEPPQYLDFRLGTLCNLRCRMCQSQNSSAIYKELKDDEVEKIKKDLFAKFGSKINLDYKVDKDLISGLIIQVGSIMIDNSMKNKLKQIKSKMIEV